MYCRYCNAHHQRMAWRGETAGFFHGVSHKGICPLLKQWRQVAKGKATVESSGLREAMVEYLRAVVFAGEGEGQGDGSSSGH